MTSVTSQFEHWSYHCPSKISSVTSRLQGADRW